MSRRFDNERLGLQAQLHSMKRASDEHQLVIQQRRLRKLDKAREKARQKRDEALDQLSRPTQRRQ